MDRTLQTFKTSESRNVISNKITNIPYPGDTSRMRMTTLCEMKSNMAKQSFFNSKSPVREGVEITLQTGSNMVKCEESPIMNRKASHEYLNQLKE